MENENRNRNINKNLNLKEGEQFENLQDKIAQKKREIYGRLNPELADVLEYARDMSFPLKHAEEFWRHYESQGWVKTNGRQLSNWPVQLETWIKRVPEFENKAAPKRGAPEKSVLERWREEQRSAS